MVGFEASSCSNCGAENQLCRCSTCDKLAILQPGVSCKVLESRHTCACVMSHSHMTHATLVND